MAIKAAKQLLEKRGLDPSEIDAIIVGTVTPDMFFPSTACIVQDEIGASNAFGFDVSAACSGFLFSLTTGARFIESGRCNKVLVIGADKMSSIVDYTDRTTCIIFGDGAGCVLLEADDDAEYGLIDYVERSDGSQRDLLHMPGGGSLNPPTHATVDAKLHHLMQEGKSVFRYAVKGMADVAEEIMDRNGLTGDDVRYLVPHQANLRIIDATARRMNISSDKVMLNIHRYGNTTAATIPLCLADWENQLRRGDNLVLAAFGGGFTWGAVYLKWAYDGSKYPVPAHLAEELEHAG
jgi:3-oxoacyl-[acyl-carrier-protein] synthase-3